MRLPPNLWRRWFGAGEGDPHHGFSLGLRAELGWAFVAPLKFDGLRGPETGEQQEPLSRAGIGAGSLDFSGAFFRVGLLVVF